jgi:hypothetical protein
MLEYRAGSNLEAVRRGLRDLGYATARTVRRLNSHIALRQPSAVSAIVSSCESVSRIVPGGRVMRSAERMDARPWLASCCWSDS